MDKRIEKIKEYFYDFKLEIFLMLVYLFLYAMRKIGINIIPKQFVLSSYFSQSKLDGIISLFAITIGVYIAVVTILALSEIGLSKQILKRNLDRRLINVIISGISENFISVILSIFCPINNYTKHILMIFILISLTSFAKFIYLLVLIFRGNMNYIAKSIDETEEYREKMMCYVKEIYEYLKKCR